MIIPLSIELKLFEIKTIKIALIQKAIKILSDMFYL
jgi:hypothetical protein